MEPHLSKLGVHLLKLGVFIKIHDFFLFFFYPKTDNVFVCFLFLIMNGNQIKLKASFCQMKSESFARTKLTSRLSVNFIY